MRIVVLSTIACINELDIAGRYGTIAAVYMS